MKEPTAPTPATKAASVIIKPTVGRVVWYWREPPTKPDQQPEAATVAYVHSDSLVNLQVIDHNGVACSATSVPLRQDGEGVPNCSFCEWMPYQKGQAAKAEELEKAAGVAR